MAISKENPQQNNQHSGNPVPHSSRPSGVTGHISSRPTGVSGDHHNSSEDEMKYGRIVRIIKAETKKQGSV
jgi:hypothetical protein